ncbi:MAG: FCD domain-containing protein [Firmicutes bacterium]|nr:FCD domain-containing protein [Bacillota bacterium]
MKPLPRSDLEYLTLKAIHEAAGAAVGSWALRETLARHGYPISEATAGRILHELDARGFTTRVSNRGRMLTQSGVERFAYLDAGRRAFGTGGAERLLDASKCKQLLEVLQARRAIERETARLAAINATALDAGRMGEALIEQERRINQGETGSDMDMLFHRLVARASGNRSLEAAYELVSQDTELAPLYEYVRLHVKGRLVDEHRKVYRAVADGNPEAAEKAMLDHIDGVMGDIRNYLMLHTN